MNIKRGTNDVLWINLMSNFKAGDDIGILLTRSPLPTVNAVTVTTKAALVSTTKPFGTVSTPNSSTSWWEDFSDFWDECYDVLIEGISNTESELKKGVVP